MHQTKMTPRTFEMIRKSAQNAKYFYITHASVGKTKKVSSTSKEIIVRALH